MEILLNIGRHCGRRSHMRVGKRSIMEEKAELANENSPWRKAAYVFFLPLTLRISYSHSPGCVHMLLFAWAPDSQQLFGLWGSYQRAKPDALSLGSWLHTVPLLPLPTQTVHWADTPEDHIVIFFTVLRERRRPQLFSVDGCVPDSICRMT